jgi:DNA-binding NarL/FixJ family response regulator
MKILFIEDHPYKKGQIENFLHEMIPGIHVEIRGSYISGLTELINTTETYDYLLLDISMPTYDISRSESGGDFIPQAGRKILKEMYLREIPIKTIVVTMYENYVDGTSIFKLDQSLKEEFNDNYLGYVYFTASNNQWKEELLKFIK